MALMLATTASILTMGTSANELTADEFLPNDPLFEQLSYPESIADAEIEAAQAMKEMLIQTFDLKPIHVDHHHSDDN